MTRRTVLPSRERTHRERVIVLLASLAPLDTRTITRAVPSGNINAILRAVMTEGLVERHPRPHWRSDGLRAPFAYTLTAEGARHAKVLLAAREHPQRRLPLRHERLLSVIGERPTAYLEATLAARERGFTDDFAPNVLGNLIRAGLVVHVGRASDWTRAELYVRTRAGHAYLTVHPVEDAPATPLERTA